MMAKINDYFLIDILKVLLAIGVVLIHSLPVTDSVSINSFLYSICRIGVPLFFCFSGFFYKGASIFHFVNSLYFLDYCTVSFSFESIHIINVITSDTKNSICQHFPHFMVFDIINMVRFIDKCISSL